MSLETLYNEYRHTGLSSLTNPMAQDSLDSFYVGLLAFSQGEFTLALDCVEAAARMEPGNLFFAEAAAYLSRIVRHGKQDVYVTGDAFAAFIRGGGNLGLYSATSRALTAVYHEYSSLRLLDVGVGDGLALLPALCGPVENLDLIEPSEAMLGRTQAELAARGIDARAFRGTLQDFIAAGTSEAREWDVIQATFSLQSIPPEERLGSFNWLRDHGRRVLIAEFDVPDFFEEMFAPSRVRYIVNRYKLGLAEYVSDGGIVAQGFLMPVMFGYFDPTTARTNYEQPISGWADEIRAAGFANVRAAPLYTYWWADAYLIDAK